MEEGEADEVGEELAARRGKWRPPSGHGEPAQTQEQTNTVKTSTQHEVRTKKEHKRLLTPVEFQRPCP